MKLKFWCTNHVCLETNECDSTPCENGGSCSDKINSFQCTCQDGYTGNTCQGGTDYTWILPSKLLNYDIHFLTKDIFFLSKNW